MEKLLVTRRISEKALRLIQEAGYETTVYTDLKNISQENLIKMCEGHIGLLSVGPNKIDEHFLQSCKQIKAIALMSVGYDKVNVDAATRHGIPVSNTPDVLSKVSRPI